MKNIESRAPEKSEMITRVIHILALVGTGISATVSNMDALVSSSLPEFAESGVLVIEDAIDGDLVRELSERLVHCSMTEDETGLFQSNTLDGSLRATFASRATESFGQCSKQTRLLVDEYKLKTHEIGVRVARFLDSLQSDSIPKIEELISRPESGSLDHFHVYRPSEIKESQGDTHISSHLSVPFHVDMGLFLLLTPGTWVHSYSPISTQQSDLIIKKKDGTTFEVNPSKLGSVILLAGAGLSNWLHRGTSNIRAAVHAVNPISKIQGGSRVVLGRMFLPPMNTVSESGVMFEDFFMSSSSRVIKAEAVDQSILQWRRLMEARCEAGSKYCWMDCMPDVDCGEDMESVCMNPNTGNICLETDCDTDCTVMCPPRPPTLIPELPASLNDTNISSSNHSAPGKNAGVSSRVAQQPVSAAVTTAKADPALFCRGGTSMVMSGFESVGSPNANCIILLFRPWLLDSPLKFGIGCLGVLLLGILVEATIKLRRFATNKLTLSKRFWRESVVISLFAVNVALGYLCMLAAMTFNVEIFISTVMGLAIGHLLLGNSSEPVRETADPCCVTSEAGNTAGVTTTLVNSTGACCCDTRPRM